MKLTLTFILLNVIVFLAQISGVINNNLAFMPAVADLKPYTLITAMFMHSSVQHLLLNMFGLFVFGSIVESNIGSKKWVLLYFFSGFLGNLGYTLLSNPFIPAIGASGAIFGLIGAAAILKPKQIIYTPYGPIPMIVAAILWGITEVISFFGVDNIAQSAHIFGLIGGAFFAYTHKKEINKLLEILLVIIPIFLVVFLSAKMPNEINGYKLNIENCTLKESKEKINLKYYLYECEGGDILSITRISTSDINPAFYYSYFNSLASEITNCEIKNSTIDINNGVINYSAKACKYNIGAYAFNCGNQRVELMQIYLTNEHKLPISCKGLNLRKPP